MTKREIESRLKELRPTLTEAMALLSDISSEVESLESEQREAFDNMPEGLQASENGQVSEGRADRLAEILESLNEAIETLESVELEVE